MRPFTTASERWSSECRVLLCWLSPMHETQARTSASRRPCSKRPAAEVSSVLLVSKPYEERRAYATACKLWPGVEFVSASTPMTFGDYVASIGNGQLVVDMLVGALQRLLLYPDQGFTVRQTVPDSVTEAYTRLCRAGFTSRLMADDT